MSAMTDKDDGEVSFTDEEFDLGAEAEAEARSNDADEDAYTASTDDPEYREMRDHQRWLSEKKRIVVLGEWHHAVFVSSRVEKTLRVSSEESMQELDYFDPESFTDEELAERLCTRIHFG